MSSWAIHSRSVPARQENFLDFRYLKTRDNDRMLRERVECLLSRIFIPSQRFAGLHCALQFELPPIDDGELRGLNSCGP
jgi:hypothetical protein